MAEQFARYRDLLLAWNKVMNLTAITDPQEIDVKHFLDSLLLLNACEIPIGAQLADIGTGAGFPGIPVKIARPDIRLTLLDTLQKRTRFLAEVSMQLGQDNAIHHARAEVAAHDPEHREQYDFATARAVAALPVLCEYCLPFVKPGGFFLALKGPAPEEEVRQSAYALQELGAELADIKQFTLPQESHRSIIVIKKISQISPQYPRKSSKITQSPL